MTIYLMSNTKKGDIRIQNELSRMIDITPCGTMTRSQWMAAIVMNLLLYGSGNSVVVPHTNGGILKSMEPIAADRVEFMPVNNSRREYRILIDGVARKPDDVMHFAYNPDRYYPWKGQGITVTLRDIAQNLKQTQKTVNAFMASEFKPSVIVKVAALAPEFASPEGRRKLIDSYVRPETPGQPWIIPAGDFTVEQVKPLTLADLAIKDTIELDKRTVASVVGVPPYLLGVGEFKRDEWNNFIQTKVRVIAQAIQQEMTRAIIISEKMYLRFNFWTLMDYDLKSVSDILQSGGDRGWVNGDEWRDRMYLPPAGLTDYRTLENYIPNDMLGKQKKLVQTE
jgi:HK97 family phage portal protein